MAYGALDHAGGAGVTTLAAQLAAGTTTGTFTVADGTGYPTGPHYVLIGPTEDLDSPSSTAEKIKVDSRSGNVFTFSTGGRAADGTTAVTHPSGSKVLHVFTATEAAEANDAVVQTIGKIQAAGDMLLGSGANQFSRVAKGADGSVFRVASGSPGWGALPADSVGASQIAAGAVGTSEIATDGVGTAEIAALAVGTAELAADAVTGAKIADDAVDSEHLVDGSIDTAHIGDSQITNAKMADDSVDSAELVDGSIDRVHLAADIVDGTKLADDAVDTEHIADDAVEAAQIADGAVGTDQLAADAVTGAKMADVGANLVLEGPSGGGNPVATRRGGSWLDSIATDSGNVGGTPTAIAALAITPALKAGRRYKIEFCGQMSSVGGPETANIRFHKDGSLYDQKRSTELGTLTKPTQTVHTFYEPGSDEALEWGIYLQAQGSNSVKIIAAATEKAWFSITDAGLALNT